MVNECPNVEAAIKTIFENRKLTIVALCFHLNINVAMLISLYLIYFSIFFLIFCCDPSQIPTVKI